MAMSADPATITAGTTAAPLYATSSSAGGITVNLPAGQSTGVANVYVTGAVSGGITVAAGVTLKLWFAGNFGMGVGSINNNNTAQTLQIFAVNPATGTPQTVNFAAGGPKYFTSDGPGANAVFNGNPQACGVFVFKTVHGAGACQLHVDETLASVGTVIDYARAMWVEDER